MSEAASTSNIVLFESSDGEVRLDVAVDAGKDEIWLNRSQMSLLFGRDVKTIGKHIANALKEELEDSPKPVVAKFATTASDGKSYQVEYYNLDVIISVGYRGSLSAALSSVAGPPTSCVVISSRAAPRTRSA